MRLKIIISSFLLLTTIVILLSFAYWKMYSQVGIPSLPATFTTLTPEEQTTYDDKHMEIMLILSRSGGNPYKFVGDQNFPFIFDSITQKIEVRLGKANSGGTLTVNMNNGTDNAPAIASISIEKAEIDLEDSDKYIQDTIDWYTQRDISRGSKTTILDKGIRLDGGIYFKLKIIDAGFPIYSYLLFYKNYVVGISYNQMGVPESTIITIIDSIYNSFKRIN